MTVHPDYRLQYDLDGICLERREGEDWVWYCDVSDTAAMAWEGLEKRLPREQLIDRLCTEFDGADPDAVARDLDALTAQLTALGLLLPD